MKIKIYNTIAEWKQYLIQNNISMRTKKYENNSLLIITKTITQSWEKDYKKIIHYLWNNTNLDFVVFSGLNYSLEKYSPVESCDYEMINIVFENKISIKDIEKLEKQLKTETINADFHIISLKKEVSFTYANNTLVFFNDYGTIVLDNPYTYFKYSSIENNDDVINSWEKLKIINIDEKYWIFGSEVDEEYLYSNPHSILNNFMYKDVLYKRSNIKQSHSKELQVKNIQESFNLITSNPLLSVSVKAEIYNAFQILKECRDITIINLLPNDNLYSINLLPKADYSYSLEENKYPIIIDRFFYLLHNTFERLLKVICKLKNKNIRDYGHDINKLYKEIFGNKTELSNLLTNWYKNNRYINLDFQFLEVQGMYTSKYKIENENILQEMVIQKIIYKERNFFTNKERYKIDINGFISFWHKVKQEMDKILNELEIKIDYFSEVINNSPFPEIKENAYWTRLPIDVWNKIYIELIQKKEEFDNDDLNSWVSDKIYELTNENTSIKSIYGQKTQD